MKKNFLPKELDSSDRDRVCISVQDGASSTELHFHDCIEIIHVANGHATVVLDGGEADLTDGDTLLLPVGRIHRCICTDEGTRRVVVGVEEELIGHSLPQPIAASEHDLLFRAADDSDVARLMTELASLSDSPGHASRLLGESAVLRIYATMYRRWEQDGLIPGPSRENAIVNAVTSYISDHYSEDLTATSVASRLGLSYSNMARLLSSHAGLGFSELLTATRIDAAKRLLITTDLPVTEVGYECGFTDTSYFISSFRRRTGRTPRAYRLFAEST